MEKQIRPLSGEARQRKFCARENKLRWARDFKECKREGTTQAEGRASSVMLHRIMGLFAPPRHASSFVAELAVVSAESRRKAVIDVCII